jgi:hypothetical protein
VRGRDALFVEGVEAIDLVFFVADFEGGFAIETVYGHDGLPKMYDFGACRYRGADRKILV